MRSSKKSTKESCMTEYTRVKKFNDIGNIEKVKIKRYALSHTHFTRPESKIVHDTTFGQFNISKNCGARP